MINVIDHIFHACVEVVLSISKKTVMKLIGMVWMLMISITHALTGICS